MPIYFYLFLFREIWEKKLHNPGNRRGDAVKVSREIEVYFETESREKGKRHQRPRKANVKLNKVLTGGSRKEGKETNQSLEERRKAPPKDKKSFEDRNKKAENGGKDPKERISDKSERRREERKKERGRKKGPQSERDFWREFLTRKWNRRKGKINQKGGRKRGTKATKELGK